MADPVMNREYPREKQRAAVCHDAWGRRDDFAETGWFEIFRAGDYGDKGKYTVADLDEICETFASSSFAPPVVIGHHNDGDIREKELADGKVIELRRDGDKLLARAEITNDKFEEHWKNNRLLSWSVALYKNFANTGKKGLRNLTALRHLAALGKTPPEVKGLNYKPVFQFAATDDFGDYDKFDCSNTASNGGNDMDELERLRAENAELKKQIEVEKAEAAKAAEFSEQKAQLENEKNEAVRRAEKAEADLKEFRERVEAERRKADFAEIAAQVEAAHTEGLPKTAGDAYAVVLAAEKGYIARDGKIEFSEEGKTMPLSEAVRTLREARWVPTSKTSEAADARQKEKTGGGVEFSELEGAPDKAADKYDELVRQLAEKKGLKDAHINVQRQAFNEAEPDRARRLQELMREPVKSTD